MLIIILCIPLCTFVGIVEPAPARYLHHYAKSTQAQPISTVNIQKLHWTHVRGVSHGIFIDFFANFAFVGIRIQFPSTHTLTVIVSLGKVIVACRVWVASQRKLYEARSTFMCVFARCSSSDLQQFTVITIG